MQVDWSAYSGSARFEGLSAAELSERLASSTGWPSVVLSPASVHELDLVASGIIEGREAVFRPAGAVSGPLASEVVLRDQEGIPLAALRSGSIRADGRLDGILEVWQRPPNRDYAALRLSPAQTRARLAKARETWVWPLGAPPAPSEVASVLDELPASARLLVLVLSTPRSRDDARHFRRVRLVLEALSGYDDGRCTFVLVSSPPESTLERRVTVALAFGGDVLVVPVGEAKSAPGSLGGLRLHPLPSQRGHQGEQALDVPAAQRGCCIFFTGLSGSGKSTLANEVLVRLLEHGGRTATLLDGDLVRANLSSELGFSKEHRDLNIRRIGFVASLIVKHGGLAICAPIAPYAATREAVRAMVAAEGGFLLIHVNTPLAVCEARDRKGLYAKARLGLITEFTGISDPYEAPQDADLVVDTSAMPLEEATEAVLGLLRSRGWLETLPL